MTKKLRKTKVFLLQNTNRGDWACKDVVICYFAFKYLGRNVSGSVEMRGSKEASMNGDSRKTMLGPARWILPVGGIVMAVLGAAIFVLGRDGRNQKPESASVNPVVRQDQKTNQTLAQLENASLNSLADLIREIQPAALATAYQRSMAMPAQPEVPPPAPTTSEIGSWKRVLKATSESYSKYQPEARKVALQMAGRMLNLTARENVAANWSDVLDPMREIFAKGCEDKDYQLRATAIDQIALVWDWVPGREMFTVERNTLAAWKGGMLGLVQPHLKDSEIPSRLAAMRTLAALPIDQAAAPGLDLLNDKEPFVRSEVIRYYGMRSSLLSDEKLLGLLHDPEQLVKAMAETALQSRGLSKSQISLGKAIISPDPKIRETVISQLDESMDIDPAVWLARLVEDKNESVRLKAVEAIAKRKMTSDLKRRLQVISESDASDAVRKSAERVLQSNSTAMSQLELPPLPVQSKPKNSTIRAN
jgi:HEAT repeat protein